MPYKSKKLIRMFSSRMNKSLIITHSLRNATGHHTQQQIPDRQNFVNKTYDTIVQGAIVIQDFKSACEKPSAPIPKKIVDWWKWYERITGLEDVETAKRQMLLVQDKLFKCQNQRHRLTHEVSAVAEKLKELYSDLIQTKRDDPKYVQLTIMENQALREQSRIVLLMNAVENEERDYFTQLATSIKEYHDSQTMNAQKYKYLSIIASTIIAILSLSGSMVYNDKRIASIQKLIEDREKKNEAFLTHHLNSIKVTMEQLGNRESPILTTDLQSTTDNHTYFSTNATVIIASLCIALCFYNRIN